MRDMDKNKSPVIQISALKNYFGDQKVHDDLAFEVEKGEIVAIIGNSGSGKTTLLNSIITLLQPTAGYIHVLGTDILHCGEAELNQIRRRWGVMFQSGALFSSLTVLENVMFPLNEFTGLSAHEIKEIALFKIVLSGLEAEAAYKFPADLSGGMRKRAALARAIALDPELLFLDEPTAGLDPQSAGDIDHLILYFKKNLGLTIVMVTHDLDTLWSVTDRVAFLGEGKVLAYEPMAQLIKREHPLVQTYFSGPRAQTRVQTMRQQRD